MAVYNEILAGRFNRFVQKLLSIKGPTSLVAMSSDLTFIHQVQSGSETRYLEGWDLFSATRNVAAVAAQLSLLQLRNPVGSGIVGVLTLAQAQGGAADGLAIYLSRSGVTTDLAGGIIATQGWDARGRPGATIIASFGNAAAPAGSFIQVFTNLFLANTTSSTPWGYEIPITPGVALTLASNSFNVSDFFVANWRERPLEDSEKF